MESVIHFATVYVPGHGLATAHLKKGESIEDGFWLEYTIDKNLWKSQWRRVEVPACIKPPLSRPRFVSLAVDDKGQLIVTVLYENNITASVKLEANPRWLRLA